MVLDSEVGEAHLALGVSGDDSDTGRARSCHRHGERHRHGGGLPAGCQLRHRRGDREIHLRHPGHQRGSVLLDPCGGHRQSCAEEGARIAQDETVQIFDYFKLLNKKSDLLRHEILF